MHRLLRSGTESPCLQGERFSPYRESRDVALRRMQFHNGSIEARVADSVALVRKSFTNAFERRFLARPVAEKFFLLLRRFQKAQRRLLLMGKTTPRNFMHV